LCALRLQVDWNFYVAPLEDVMAAANSLGKTKSLQQPARIFEMLESLVPLSTRRRIFSNLPIL